MNFHWCGNWIHDIIHNFLVLLILLPAAIPMLGYLRRRALDRYKALHKEEHCCEGEAEEQHGVQVPEVRER